MLGRSVVLPEVPGWPPAGDSLPPLAAHRLGGLDGSGHRLGGMKDSRILSDIMSVAIRRGGLFSDQPRHLSQMDLIEQVDY